MAIEYKGYAGAINNTQPSQHLTDSKYIQGTYYTVDDLTALNALPIKTGEDASTDGIIIPGCLAYVVSESKFYQYSEVTPSTTPKTYSWQIKYFEDGQKIQTSDVSFGDRDTITFKAGSGGTITVTGNSTNKDITIESKVSATDTTIDW